MGSEGKSWGERGGWGVDLGGRRGGMANNWVKNDFVGCGDGMW